MRLVFSLLTIVVLMLSSIAWADKANDISILCYHNLNPTTHGDMNLTPAKFESQIQWIRDHGYTVIPLKQVVEYLQGKTDSLPPKSVVITADDGWKSNYTYLYPIVKKYQIPVTLFIYPGTISEGKHAMTWDELKELQQSGYFDIQAHTYSHPNFKQEQKRLSPEAYQRFVDNELIKSKKILEEKLGIKITLLAWPFGIYNPDLEQAAQKAGYIMAFTIDARPANRNFRPMAQPRFMIVDSENMKIFAYIVSAKGHL